MDRFEELQTFVRVVECGGIGAAAARQSVAKSAVSRRLQALENRLGVKLLQRTTRRSSLTEDGRRFYEQARRILDELDEAERSLSSEQQRVTGVLRVAAPLSFAIRHLSALFDEFMQRYPEVRLELDLQDRQINVVEEGVDLTIRIGKLDDSSLVARRLGPVRNVVCASPEYLARYGEPESPEALVKHHGLAYGNVPDQRQWTLFDRDGVAHVARPRIRMRVNNGELILDALIAGLGVAVMPTFLCYRALQEGRLRQILQGFSPELNHAYVLYPSRQHLPLRVRVFIDFLIERLAALVPWEAG